MIGVHLRGHSNKRKGRGTDPGVFAQPLRVSSLGQTLSPLHRLWQVVAGGAVGCEGGLGLFHRLSHGFGIQYRGQPRNRHHHLHHARPDKAVSNIHVYR